MNQDEPVQVDRNVLCQSDLASFDWNLWNQFKFEKGDYLLANLLEIHLTFQHYRCESFSNYTQSSFVSTHSLDFPNNTNFQQSKSLLSKDSISNNCLQVIQSLPSSSKTDPNLATSHEFDIAVYQRPAISFPFNNSKQKHSKLKSSKDFRNLLRVFSSLKRYNPTLVGSKLNCFRSNKRFNKSAISNTNNISDNLYTNNKRTSIRNHLQTITSKPISKSEIVHCHQVGNQVNNSINKPTSDLISENNEDLISDYNSNIAECDIPRLVDGTAILNKCSPVSDFNLVQAQIVNNTQDSTFVTSSSFLNVPLKSPLCENLADPVVSSKCKFSETDLYQFPVIVSASNIPHSHSNRSKNFKDYCSLSEYSLTRSNIRHYINADVCSLPNCIDDELSSKMLDNKSSVSSQHRMPSYVNISRAISGYANYNKYSSDTNRDGSYLNSLLFTPTSNHSLSSPISNRRQLKTGDDIDNFSSLPYEPTQEKILLDENDKSFLQRKIESLYGESFAENWKKSRPKSRSPKSESTSLNKTRSPSCPPRNPQVDSENVLNTDKLLHKNKSLDCTDNSKFDRGIEFSEEKLNLFIKSSSNDDQATHNLNDTGDRIQKASSTPDAHWFLEQLNKQSTEIQYNIDKCQQYLLHVESIPEETVGKIRATIGKANLLLNKKFQQFEKLCRDSLIQQDDEEFKIKCDDLGGFWDMVLIQVKDINFSFNELEQLNKKDWKLDELDSIQNTSTFQSTRRASNPTNLKNSSQRSKLASPKSSPSLNKKDSPNGVCREAERKNRLMEIKRKGKLKAMESADEEIAIFTCTTDTGINQD